MNTMNDLIDLTKQDMEKVNTLILQKMGSNVEIIPAVSEHLISSGGKRLRPMLTLASASMFGYEGDQHIQLAMAVEFMHTATLLHDDVVDESDLRRGRATARKIWGNQASVLVGDFLLGQAFKTMVDVGSIGALNVLSNAAVLIAEGEVLQLSATHDVETTIDVYLKIIEAKTAVLFSAAAEVGPIIAKADLKKQQAMRNYGTYLGIAFQLVDDVLDYSGQSSILGKNVGDDFREGKITLPFIFCYEKATEEEKSFLRQAFVENQNDDKSLETTLSLMHKYQALDQTINLAKQYGQKAFDSIECLKENAFKQALFHVINFCISRLL